MAWPDRDARMSHCSFALFGELPLKILNLGEKFIASAMHRVTELFSLSYLCTELVAFALLGCTELVTFARLKEYLTNSS